MNATDSEGREGGDKDSARTGEPEAMDERLDLWLDGRLSEDERKRFEAELEGNPEQKEEAHSLASILSVVRNLPEERAPQTMLTDVQNRLRGQTGGRVYGGPKLHVRFPYEALVQSLLLIGAVLFFALASPRQPKLIVMEPKEPLASESDLSRVLEGLGEFGKFREDERESADGPRVLVGEVANDKMDGLRAELARRPWMHLESETVEGQRTQVRISIKP